jgi:4-amino-4-deoxy-L-arabinose transferase-like glycosyltransferase
MTAIPETAKAYVALFGAIATALLGVYTADSDVGKVLTVVAVIATAFATWATPNAAQPAHRDDQGNATLYTIVLALAGVALVLWLLDALRVINLS